MGRLIGPDEASREVKAIVGRVFQSKAGRPVQLWADAAATVPADVLTEAGAAIPASTVTIDSSSMLPLVQYPPGDVDVIYGTCDGGPAWPVYARTDDRLDALGGRVGTVEGVAAAAETPAGAQAKVNAAVAAEVARSRREASFLARGAVMFSLDDGRAQNMELVALHEAYGQRITLGIVSDWVDDPGRLTSAQVLDFHNRGHEIANHTQTHANYTSVTATQRATESDTCSDFIEALTGVRPVSLIYPQGAWSTTTDRELYGRFRSWAATLSPTTNLPPINRLGDTFPRYYRVDLDQVANLDRALELVRLAARAPVVVAFYTHWTDQPGTMTTAQYQSIAQLAYDLGVPAVLPRDMFGGFSALADSSFEVAGLPNWIQSVTGAGATGHVTDTPDAGIAGTKALSLAASNPDTAYRSQAIWAEPNTTYRISGRLRCPSGTLATNDVAVRIRWRLADESAISTASVLPAVSGTGWTRFEGDLTSPALARMALVDCYLAPAAGRGGTAHLDHLDIRPAEQGGLG